MIHGTPKLAGTWKAWRALDGFGIDDELRVVDESGNPRSLSRAVRVYSSTDAHWNVATIDAYRGRVTTGTAQFQDGEMRSTGQGIDGEGKPYQLRTRYFDVTGDAFKMRQDRSYDDGKTWTEGFLLIEAKRVAATAPR
jgi:hypothetical protein